MPRAANITASSAAPSRYRPVLIGSLAQFTQNAHSSMPRARRGIISPPLKGGSAVQVLDDVGVLSRLDHAESTRLTLERGGARCLAQLTGQFNPLLLELGKLLLAGLGSLPRLEQAHHRI